MTPKWIDYNAVITGPHALYPQYFEIAATTGVALQRALQIQLIAPNILTSNDNITVTVTVAVDKTIADLNDHDMIFGVSDGTSFTGFKASDKGNYNARSPCIKAEGIVGSTLRNRIYGSGPLVLSRHYSSEIKVCLKPNEKWSSCLTVHDGGYINNQNYQSSLNLANGLHFEVYREDAHEKYRIKYIVVDVDLD